MGLVLDLGFKRLISKRYLIVAGPRQDMTRPLVLLQVAEYRRLRNDFSYCVGFPIVIIVIL